MSRKPRQIKPRIGEYDEITFAGISLRAYHGFDERWNTEAKAVCEHIADLKDEILKCLKFIHKEERRTRRSLETVLYLTDPEDDQKRWDEKRPRSLAEGYNLNIHFVDSWKQRKDIYESYEISIERDLHPTAVYVMMRFLDPIYGK